MFGLGAWEIGLILLVALIVIGPKKLPEVAAQLGKGMRELQRAATDFTREINTPEPPVAKTPPAPANDPYRNVAVRAEEEAAPDEPLEGYPLEDDASDAAEKPADMPLAAKTEPSGDERDLAPMPAIRPATGAVAFGAPDPAPARDNADEEKA